METKVKFDAKKCMNYIREINDFVIDFERKPTVDEASQTPVYALERISVKEFLKRFVVQCMDSGMNDYLFLQWLSDRREFWRSQYMRVCGPLCSRINRAAEEDKAYLMKRHDMYEKFFRHNQDLIKMIEEDILSSVEHVIDKIAFGSFHDLPGSAEKMNPKKTGAKLVQQEIALLCTLDDVDISTYLSKPSRKLLQHCNAYKDKRKRTEILPEMSYAMAMHVRRRYEKVMPQLKTEEGKKRAMEELEIVRKKIKETHFENKNR